MKQLKNLIFFACMFTATSTLIFADCSSCSTQTNCCKKECVKFEKKARAFCALLAQNLDACNAFINNATFRTLHVLGNENIDGDLIVNGQVAVQEDLTINGELTIDGEPLIAAFSQFASFVRTAPQLVTNDATLASIVAFDTAVIPPTSGITNTAGIITFAEAGLYLINFSATGLFDIVTNPAFGLTNIPVTGTNITGTNFVSDSGNNNQISGPVLLQITAGQQIGVRNFSGTPITLTVAGAASLTQPNVAAAITIVKLN
jgi:hypothetical protein